MPFVPITLLFKCLIYFFLFVLSCWSQKQEEEKGEISWAGHLHTEQTNTSRALLTWTHTLKRTGTSNAIAGTGRGPWAQQTRQEQQMGNSRLRIILKTQRRPTPAQSLASRLHRVCCPSHQATGWEKTAPNIPTAAGSWCPSTWKPSWRSSPSHDTTDRWILQLRCKQLHSEKKYDWILRQMKTGINWLQIVRKKLEACCNRKRWVFWP